MPLYTVIAADAQTGQDVRTEIEARDKFTAERIARERGLLVERVEFATLDYRRETPLPQPASRLPLVVALIVIIVVLLVGAAAMTWFGVS